MKEKLSATELQDLLVEYFENGSDWRERVAAEYPDDKRNTAAAEELSQMAEQMRALSADDPALLAYAAAYNRLPDASYDALEITEMVQGVGFRGGWDTPQAFLGDLAARLERFAEKDEATAES